MSKLSSKLAAGVRKVKAEQETTPAASAAPKVAPVSESKAPQRRPDGADLHPARVWPD